MEERLQKIIARAGIASRRRAEGLITSGLVSVNGELVTQLGSKADASRDHIKVSGKLLQAPSENAYLIFHKPPETVCTMSDPEGRKSLSDYLRNVQERVFPVGRLEYHAAGLVLLTNDGDFANRVLQARTLRQTFHLKLKSLLTFAEIEALARATGARIARLRGKDTPWYEATLSGVSRDTLRDRLFQGGHPVERMKRARLGPIDLGSLGPGEHRMLSVEEVAKLRRALDGREESADVKVAPGRGSERRPGKFQRYPQGGREQERGSRPPGFRPRPATASRPGQGRPEQGGPGREGRPASRPSVTGRPPRPGGPSTPGRPSRGEGRPPMPGRPARPGRPPKGRPSRAGGPGNSAPGQRRGRRDQGRPPRKPRPPRQNQ